MHTQEITAEIRTATGKGVARQMRRAGQIPAVLYGGTQEATMLTLDPTSIEQLRRKPLGLNTPIELNVDGMAGTRLVMVKDLQRHPLSRKLLHIDFIVIDPKQPVLVEVTVEAVGRSIGIQGGGRLNIMRRKVLVRCMLADIPESIEVDITEYDVGHKIMVDELTLPANVEAIYEQRYPVLGITTRGAALVEETDEEEEGEEGLEEGEEGAEGEPAESDGDSKE